MSLEHLTEKYTGHRIDAADLYTAGEHGGFTAELASALTNAVCNLSDRDPAQDLLARLRMTHPELPLTCAGSAYTGIPASARDFLNLAVKIVKVPADQVGFKRPFPAAGSVERSTSWVMQARRRGAGPSSHLPLSIWPPRRVT